MGRNFLVACLGASLAGTPLAAKEAEPVVVAPSSQWQVDFGSERCRAIRTFGPEKDKTLLIIDQIVPNSEASWTVAGRSVEALRGTAANWTLQFGPTFPAITGHHIKGGTFPGFGKAIVGQGFVGHPDHDPGSPAEQIKRYRERQAAASQGQDETTSDSVPDEQNYTYPTEHVGKVIDWIELSDGKRVQRLATGNLAELFRLMKLCSDNIVKVWGLDPAVQSTLTRKASPKNMPAIIRSVTAVYPRGPEARGMMTMISVRLMIDETGKPTSCTMTEVADAKGFGDIACRQIMKVAEFEPALDAKGAPVASYWTQGVKYRIGG